MTPLTKRLLSLLSTAAIAAPGSAFLLPQATRAAQPSPLESISANKQNSNDAHYQQVRNELESSLGRVGEDYYLIYRIVERLSRANGLDEQPWRIRVTETDVFNATASDLNMLTFYGGLLEQLQGDTAAIACVVGHEMAHHTEQHAQEQTEVAARLEALQIEALEEARAEVEASNRQANVFGAVIGVVTNTVGVDIARSSRTGWIATGVANDVLNGLNEEQANRAAARAEEIYAARLEELNEEFSAVSKEAETEADAIGYEYIVRAGFEPDGCVRAMGSLTRITESRLPGITHPKAADRVAALTALNTPTNNQTLTTQGEANLSRSANPLEYGFGRDGSSLRVESRFGSRDIDDGFPQ
ncbi:MAG: M48 family metalloprotease [Cyanobacteria bacterium P01_D01_bin.105]